MSDPVFERFLLPASLDSLESARRWSSALVRTAGVQEEILFELELVLTEALSNTIRHSYGQDDEQLIELLLTIDTHRVALTIVDRGLPFDASEYRPPDFDDLGEGGYGIHILEELTDELTRRQCADGATLVTLVKYRRHGL